MKPGLIDPTRPDVDANRVPLPERKAPKSYQKHRDHTASQIALSSPRPPLSDLESALSSSSEDTSAPSSVGDRRTSTEILVDRLLIVATNGARALERGASTNFEDWDPVPY